MVPRGIGLDLDSVTSFEVVNIHVQKCHINTWHAFSWPLYETSANCLLMEVQGKIEGHGCFFKSQDSSRLGWRPIFATRVEMILQAGNHNLEGGISL